MANPKKKGRKILVFSVIVVVVAGLAALAVFRKREPVITVQTEKVSRKTLTEIVVANGRIQPVLQVKISPEVSGEIIELPLKEGQTVKKGDLIMKIKPDFYIARRNEAEASYKSSLASITTAEANLARAVAELKRSEELFQRKLISESVYMEVKTTCDVARAQLQGSRHQVEMSNAFLARADEELGKTTIVAPLTGTISKLNSQLGERVVGTATMAGTDVMIIADLNEMEARVDIGEVDIVLIKPGQKARLEVDSFKDRKFTGEVTEIANSSKGLGLQGSSTEATKFEVKIRIKESEQFRPGMSVTSEIETRYRTNVLSVPIASVTTRAPKPKDKDDGKKGKAAKDAKGVSVSAKTNTPPASTNTPPASTVVAEASGTTNATTGSETNTAATDKKGKEGVKPIEVVFVMDGEKAKMVPVKIGISDDTHWEILEGLTEGQEVVSGGYRAISRDLEDGKKVKKGVVSPDKEKDGEKKDQT